MNIRSETDRDRGHKLTKLVHFVSRNIIRPTKDIKIYIFCPGSHFSFSLVLQSTCLKGLLSNAFLLLYLVVVSHRRLYQDVVVG